MSSERETPMRDSEDDFGIHPGPQIPSLSPAPPLPPAADARPTPWLDKVGPVRFVENVIEAIDEGRDPRVSRAEYVKLLDRLRAVRPVEGEDAALRKAAELVVVRMPRRPEADENGETPGVHLGPGAPIWDAIDALRAALAARAPQSARPTPGTDQL